MRSRLIATAAALNGTGIDVRLCDCHRGEAARLERKSFGDKPLEPVDRFLTGLSVLRIEGEPALAIVKP